jgi:hypothetical protein
MEVFRLFDNQATVVALMLNVAVHLLEGRALTLLSEMEFNN